MHIPPEAARQSGRFTYQQARASGLTARQLDRAVRDGLVKETARGVYAVTSQLDDPALVQAAMVRDFQLASRSPWYAARRSAALLMGLPLIGYPPQVPQLVRDGSRQGTQGKSRHLRVSPLPPSDTWEYQGIAMTSAARTVADISRAESFRNGVVIADAALRRGMPREELEAVLARMTRWPGVRRARRVLAFADGHAESPGESVTRVACAEGGLPIPQTQIEVSLHGSFVARLDLFLEEYMLAVEFDGKVKFDGERVMPELLIRQERIRDCGIDVLRTFWSEAYSDPLAFRRRLRERMAERGPRKLLPGVELQQASLRFEPPLLGSPIDHLAA